jgi:hypothetical protein
MAETATKTTTTPRRRTAAAKPPAKTAAKPAANKPAAKPTPEPEATQVDKFVVEFDYVSDTKSYAKFAAPANLNGTLVGNIYAPLGTDRVRVQVIGVDGTEADED